MRNTTRLICGMLAFAAALSCFAAKVVPPAECNSDAARTYMRTAVSRKLFVDPSTIVSIATLGGAGGSGGSQGDPKDAYYSSEMHCPIRITVKTGGYRFVTFNERYSNTYGEEVKLTDVPFRHDDPVLQWTETNFK